MRRLTVPSVHNDQPHPQLLDLVRCDRSTADRQATLATIPSPGAWDALVVAAEQQGVAPLLHAALKQHRAQVPDEAWRRLRKLYQGSAAASVLQTAEWQAVVQALRARGIRVLVLKGAAIAQALYGDPALRPMTDLDLLVPHAQLNPAQAALETLGYTPFLAEESAGAHEEFESQLEMGRRDAHTSLLYRCELHWHLVDAPFYQHKMPVNWFWNSATPLRLGQIDAEALGPEAQLLHLCVHLALHHQSARLIWFCDVDRLLRRYEAGLQWAELQSRAEAFHVVLPLRDVLLRTQEWLGAPVPDRVKAELSKLPVSREEERVLALLTRGPQPTVVRFAGDLSQMPGLRVRLHYFLVAVFPSAAYMRERYGMRHNVLLPFYYLYRIAHGAADGLRAWAQKL